MTEVVAALRSLTRNPKFSLFSIFVLAIGIGVAATTFSAFDTLILRPRQFAQSEGLVVIWTSPNADGSVRDRSALANVEDWSLASEALDDFAVYDPATATIHTAGHPERAAIGRVSPELFELLPGRPILGRMFTAQESELGERVAVVSEVFWRDALGGSEEVGGQPLIIDGDSYQIVGVMDRGFDVLFPETNLWVPHTTAPGIETMRTRRGIDSWYVVARLAPGVAVRSARAELRGIAARLSALHEENAGLSVDVEPLDRLLVGTTVRGASMVLLVAVGLILLVACVNVGQLFLARGRLRAREIMVRKAVGASRSRIVRQFLAEGLLISAGAAILGWASTVPLSRMASATLSGAVPAIGNLAPGWATAVMVSAMALVVTTFFALVPAVALSRTSASALRAGSSTTTRQGRRVDDVLLVVEIGLVIALVTGSTLLVRSLDRLRNADLGIRVDRAMVAGLAVPREMPEPERAVFFETALDRVSSITGVESVGAIEDHHVGSEPNVVLTVDNASSKSRRATMSVDAVAGHYFQAVGAALLRGRHFRDEDGPDSPRVAIVNEAMVRAYWNGVDPIGRRFRFGEEGSDWLTIVGVVGDMRRQGLTRDPIPQVFVPYRQRPSLGMVLVLHAEGDPLDLVPAIRSALAVIDDRVPLYGVTTLEADLRRSMLTPSLQATLTGLFSAFALVLAQIGIFGSLVDYVRRQRRAIAIRLTIGASPRSVIVAVLARAMRLIGAGTVLGVLLVLLLTEQLKLVLFEVSPLDPVSIAFACAMVLLAGLIAAFVPVRAAARTDPVQVLRSP